MKNRREWEHGTARAQSTAAPILPCSGFPYPFRGKPSGRRSRRLSLRVSRFSRLPPRPSVSPGQLLSPCGGKPLNPRALLCYCREQQGIVSGYRPITSDKDTEKGMKQVILGTAGHIDHGKTSLIRALTGIDTDRLKEEKLRGITIELGFAYLNLPTGALLGIVDVPGHERFVKHMVAGATGIDLVALVIAADEGVMPQTREHLEICQLLRVKKGLVVLTKIDLLDDPDWLDLVREDVREFLKATFLEGAPIIAVSAVTGQGLEELKTELARLVADVEPRSSSGPFRLPVDRVFTMKGFGTVVTGTCISGRLRVGDAAAIYPSGHRTKVRGLQVHNREVQEIQPGERTAINLQSLDRGLIERGDVVSTPGAMVSSYMVDVHMELLSSAPRPLKNRAKVRFHTGTAENLATVVLLDRTELQPGASAFVQIRLDSPWRSCAAIAMYFVPIPRSARLAVAPFCTRCRASTRGAKKSKWPRVCGYLWMEMTRISSCGTWRMLESQGCLRNIWRCG